MENTLKLSILLQKNDLSQHSIDLIKWCIANKKIELVCLIWMPDKSKSIISILENFFWKSLLHIEKIKLNIKKVNRANLMNHINVIQKLKEFSLLPEDQKSINQINKQEVDIHIALNLEPILMTLKDHSRYGVLGFHYEEGSQKKHNPYFFNEVLNRKDNTAFKVLHLHPNIEKVSIVQQGAFPTHGYFLANKQNVLKRQNFYMYRQIEALIERRMVNLKMLESIAVYPIKQAPSLYDQFKYLLHIVDLIFKRFSAFFKSHNLWNVGIYRGTWRSLNFANSIIISNPRNHFLADPFVMNKNNKDYCFVEDFDLKKSKGVISVYEIGNTQAKKVGLALEENFHLSFPYLFEFDSKTYMLPETSENNDIRLYEAIEFPLKWKLSKVIMKNIFAVDSMVFKYEDRWWLFTNINPIGDPDTCSELSLFYSDHPINGKWVPHEKNPVIFDPSSARNGGIIIENNSIYRIGQKHLFGTYGAGGFSVNKITELTPDTYKEEQKLIINPNFFTGNKGAHHFHTNGTISTFDFLT
ncbi:hypothetical protein OAB45_04700 [Gammaproteobacteria bacterium]|nr:hypothetical protein [Gammaproteobacteria bacterium]